MVGTVVIQFHRLKRRSILSIRLLTQLAFSKSLPEFIASCPTFVLKKLPKNAECLMDCEAADILQGIQEQMVILSEDPTIKIPLPLKKHGVTDREICMIANIPPESADEVFVLTPSLKGKKNKVTELLKVAFSDLAKLKQSA